MAPVPPLHARPRCSGSFRPSDKHPYVHVAVDGALATSALLLRQVGNPADPPACSSVGPIRHGFPSVHGKAHGMHIRSPPFRHSRLGLSTHVSCCPHAKALRTALHARTPRQDAGRPHLAALAMGSPHPSVPSSPHGIAIFPWGRTPTSRSLRLPLRQPSVSLPTLTTRRRYSFHSWYRHDAPLSQPFRCSLHSLRLSCHPVPLLSLHCAAQGRTGQEV